MKNQSGNLERILQECINEIIADNAQLEELLERYPEYRVELEPLLRVAFWLNEKKHIFDPEEKFIEESWQRLRTRITKK